MVNAPQAETMVYFGKTTTGRRGRGRRCARCVCVITVTAPLPRRQDPRGISYDHPAVSASLGTGDQTNRLPIALLIIGTIDTGAARVTAHLSGIEVGSAATFEEGRVRQLNNVFLARIPACSSPV